jgi:hypothetical protein
MAFEKSDSLMRWPVLAFACFMMLGSYYCYDNPSALGEPMMNATPPGWNMSGIEFNLQVRLVVAVCPADPCQTAALHACPLAEAPGARPLQDSRSRPPFICNTTSFLSL